MIDRILSWLGVSESERLRMLAQIGREAVLAMAAIIALFALIVGCKAEAPMTAFSQAVFAAAMSILAIVLIRLADANGNPGSTRRRGRTASYAGLWLTSFALVFGALSLADTLRSIAPLNAENGAVRGSRNDARCVDMANPKATAEAKAKARARGCKLKP